MVTISWWSVRECTLVAWIFTKKPNTSGILFFGASLCNENHKILEVIRFLLKNIVIVTKKPNTSSICVLSASLCKSNRQILEVIRFFKKKIDFSCLFALSSHSPLVSCDYRSQKTKQQHQTCYQISQDTRGVLQIFLSQASYFETLNLHWNLAVCCRWPGGMREAIES